MRHCACWVTEAFGGSRNSYSRVLHSSLMSSTTIDPLRHKHGCLLQPSRSGISLLFHSFFLIFYFLYMFAAEMQHYPTVLQRKTSIQCLEHTVSRTASAGGEPENFFLAQIIFFSPSRVAFGVLMWRETKKIIAVALTTFWFYQMPCCALASIPKENPCV